MVLLTWPQWDKRYSGHHWGVSEVIFILKRSISQPFSQLLYDCSLWWPNVHSLKSNTSVCISLWLQRTKSYSTLLCDKFLDHAGAITMILVVHCRHLHSLDVMWVLQTNFGTFLCFQKIRQHDFWGSQSQTTSKADQHYLSNNCPRISMLQFMFLSRLEFEYGITISDGTNYDVNPTTRIRTIRGVLSTKSWRNQLMFRCSFVWVPYGISVCVV